MGVLGGELVAAAQPKAKADGTAMADGKGIEAQADQATLVISDERIGCSGVTRISMAGMEEG